MAKKEFSTVAAQVREATGAAEPITLADATPAKKATKAKKGTAQHINIALSDDQLSFLKAFSKIRGESYGEVIGAMIDRAQRENSELVALVAKAKAAL